MARYNSDAPEKFRRCKSCGSNNTKELLNKEDESTYRYTYFGWCFNCLDTYYYSFHVDNVWDRKGRI